VATGADVLSVNYVWFDAFDRFGGSLATGASVRS
jgi:hypothetical protein